MKKYLLILMLFVSELNFAQTMKFYVNDTLANFENTNCWSSQFINGFPKDSIYHPLDAELTQIGNCIQIKFSHGGGCGNSYFKMYVDTSQLTTHSTIKLYPNFISNDYCEMLCLRRIKFDISQVFSNRKSPISVLLAETNKSIQVERK